MDQSIYSPVPKSDKGISIFIVILILIIVVFSAFLIRFLILQNTSPLSVSAPALDTFFPQSQTTPSISKPTPSPTPLLGPGKYACSFLGDCKNWDPDIQKKNCTTTYADPKCLNECGDPSKRCKI